MLRTLDNVRISTKLPVVILLAAGLVAAAVGIIAYGISSNHAHQASEQRLVALVDSRRKQLGDYLKSIEQDLRIVAENATVAQAIGDFKEAWEGIEGSQTEVLQKAYIADSPHPTGEKEKLDRAEADTPYNNIHGQYHPWFRKLLQERGYYDIFLFDGAGNLLYTVFKELDYATNLNNGEYKDTDLGNSFRVALESAEAGSIHFFDFRPYAPSHGAPASFMATPVVANGEKVGVLVFQMPVDVINAMMKDAKGMGETGEIMIIGADNLLRNDSAFTKDNDILKTRIENHAVSEALAGRIGHAQNDAYRDTKMAYVAEPMAYRGTRWAIAGVQSVAEIDAPILKMGLNILLVSLGMMAVMGAAGFWISRSMTRPITGVVEAMSRLAEGDTEFEIPNANRKDEIGDMSKAVKIFQENAIERAALQSESEKQQQERGARQKKVDDLIASFRESSKTTLDQLASNNTQMETTAKSLSSIAEQASRQAGSAATSSDESNSNVQAVAAAAEELSASIAEITRQVSQTTEVVNQASNMTGETDAKIASLSDAAQRIGDVVAMIQEIAEQTNLLALNATIEAARAGESGKGFAVVASEVKELATQTGKATSDISDQITDIQEQTNSSVEAIRSIATTMEEVKESTTAIAAAVEQQGSATQEISRNVQEAAKGSGDVSENISGVTAAAGETTDSAGQVLTATKAVAQQADALNTIIDKFLDEVAAA